MSTTALASVTQTIAPTTIGLGEAAQLTIAASGAEADSITPPMVAGLEFVAVGQSQRIESINGTTHATASIIYQVIPRRAGVFTIPSETAGAPPLVLTVSEGHGGASPSNGSAASSALPPAAQGAPTSATQTNGNGSAFVRLRLSRRDLYVGETIPVDIQVGTRDGVVASLNGQPTLNGDAFTLDTLSAQPERTAEVIDGKPFTVFTWHSALAAVKPGYLSLTMETPLTVRIRTAPHPDSGMFGDSALDDAFNAQALQSFFGTSTEKDITVASSPATFTVQSLPVQDRPVGFSGAVGQFAVSSGLSNDKAAVGDPITLSLHVTGRGNFDRVSSPMLHDAPHWKTYAPTTAFKPADSIGYTGEKTFEQPVIPTQAGAQALPALAFSWFDPTTRRYVEAHTSVLRVAVDAASGSEGSAASNVPLPPAPGTPAVSAPAALADGSGLRPNHVETGSTVASLRPHYFDAPYVAAPSLFALAFLSAGFWVRRRERVADESSSDREREAALQTAPSLAQMERAAKTGNAELFFESARQAVQRALASRWNLPPSSVTLEEAAARLGSQTDVVRLFELADEARYSTVGVSAIDFKRWTGVVLQQINGERVS